MKRSPVLATLLVMGYFIGAPIALMNRFSSDLSSFRPMDIPLAIAVISWILLAKSLLDRSDVVDSRSVHQSSARFKAHQLVEQSAFGVGALRSRFSDKNEIEPMPAHLLIAPEQDVSAFLPPPLAPRAADTTDAPTPERRPRSTGRTTSHSGAPDSEQIEILATEEYTIRRGETWWSIAEATLGDGRHWIAVRDINLGRTVAPDHELAEDDEPRIGWNVLIPLVPAVEENHAP